MGPKIAQPDVALQSRSKTMTHQHRTLRTQLLKGSPKSPKMPPNISEQVLQYSGFRPFVAGETAKVGSRKHALRDSKSRTRRAAAKPIILKAVAKPTTDGQASVVVVGGGWAGELYLQASNLSCLIQTSDSLPERGARCRNPLCVQCRLWRGQAPVRAGVQRDAAGCGAQPRGPFHRVAHAEGPGGRGGRERLLVSGTQMQLRQ